MSDYDVDLNDLEDMDRDCARTDQLYIRGKELHKILDAYDDMRDPRAMDEFDTQHMRSTFDMEALNYYLSCIEKDDSKQEASTPSVTKQNQSSPQTPWSIKKTSDLVRDYIDDRSNGQGAWQGKTRGKYENQQY